MKAILAIGHTEMQKFIAQNYNIDIVDIAENVEELYEQLSYSRADTLVLSKYLMGSENPQLIIDRIVSIRSELRIIYFYGAEDSSCKSFVRYLESKNIRDYHIGENISSIDVSRLLFGSKNKYIPVIKSLFKDKTRTMRVKELDTAVINIYSNSSNGKSHFSWNLSTAFANLGYRTTLINIDRGYSSNVYFGIKDIYFDLLDYLIKQGAHTSVLDSCFKKGNLNIISGNPGSNSTLSGEDFLKLLYYVRHKCDILIIDTYTGLNDTTFHAINNSTIDFLIFDSDLMHFHMNKLMIEKLGNDFVAEKTYAIINNCNTGSESYKYIYKQINKLNINFKGVMPLSTCGSLGCDLMSTGKAPCESTKNSSFSLDLNAILSTINARNKRNTAK